MPDPLDAALDQVRGLLLDRPRLVRAVAAGHRRNARPTWSRAELRPVTLKSGERLQISVYDGQRPHIRNVPWDAAPAEVDELLAEPYGNWHVRTTEQTVQLRVTKRGEAQVHAEASGATRDGEHDRAKQHLLDPGDPLFGVLGANASKRRQVDAFLRFLEPVVADHDGVLRVVDMGCGNAYLTFAAYRYLSGVRGLEVELTGVDQRADQRERNTALAKRLGWDGHVRFVEGTIIDAPTPPEGPPHVVLALHACDTATDDALARAVQWQARHILAAPCCHHELSAQLRASHGLLTRHGILRERFADVLTDSLRAALLRLAGYRVEVAEFIASQHTPRNVLLRAERTGTPPTKEQIAEYEQLVAEWGVQPKLAALLG